MRHMRLLDTGQGAPPLFTCHFSQTVHAVTLCPFDSLACLILPQVALVWLHRRSTGDAVA